MRFSLNLLLFLGEFPRKFVNFETHFRQCTFALTMKVCFEMKPLR